MIPINSIKDKSINNDSTVIRGHRVNFFDDVDVHYMASLLEWENFKENPKRKDVHVEKIQGYSSRTYDKTIWDERIPDCLYTTKNYGSNKNLIVVVAEENWLQEELFFVPSSVLSHRKNSDILVIKEEIKNNTKPIMHNLTMGLNAEYNTFESMCKLLRQQYIKDNYSNIVLVAGGEVVVSGLAIAQEFSELINNVFLYDGTTNYSWYDDDFLQLSHNMSIKSEYLFQKTGRHDKKSDLINTNDLAFFILKCGYFLRHKLDRRILTPFLFVKDHSTQNVEYYFWKDTTHIQWLRKAIYKKSIPNFTTNNIKQDNPPAYFFNTSLPIKLHKILDK
jgi:hypothetical protein